MADRFSLDPSETKEVGSKVNGAAREFQDRVASLRSVLDAHRGCWGTDDIGNKFAPDYLKGETANLESADGMQEAATDWSEGLGTTVDAFVEVDDSNRDDVMSVTEYDHVNAEYLKNPPPP